MSRGEVVRIARECGWQKLGRGLEYPVLIEMLERFHALATAAERKACAELCEEMEDRENSYERNVAVLDCASAIRARGE